MAQINLITDPTKLHLGLGELNGGALDGTPFGCLGVLNEEGVEVLSLGFTEDVAVAMITGLNLFLKWIKERGLDGNSLSGEDERSDGG